MDWSNGVQDKGGPPARPPAGHSDNIIPCHLIWRGTKRRTQLNMIIDIHVPVIGRINYMYQCSFPVLKLTITCFFTSFERTVTQLPVCFFKIFF